MSSKIEIRGKIDDTTKQLDALEKKCEQAGVETQPWLSADNPLSLEHWGLVQRRIGLQADLKKPSFTPERRKATADRLKAACQAKRNARSAAILPKQTADLVPDRV
jgi:hypothetical protein